MKSPVKQVDNVFSDVEFNDLIRDIENHNFNFVQKYPKRLFSTNDHHDWLIEKFGKFIQNVAKPFCNAVAVQQIFIGYELPGSAFMMHRSHPAIAGVAVYNLDDYLDLTLDYFTDTFDHPDDYINLDSKFETVKHNFKKNSALIVKNTDPRYHWGFSRILGTNQIKRSVWIYLGKEN